jgi:hypothetical protein
MEVELTDHLGYERHQEPPGGGGNTRNGSTSTMLSTEHGPVQIRTRLPPDPLRHAETTAAQPQGARGGGDELTPRVFPSDALAPDRRTHARSGSQKNLEEVGFVIRGLLR